ncbi:MAG: pyridoxamine 5'-phosphate oxidase family protein [Thermoleophilaceae bacterium]|nr:pyridoxamine 5'-phosphate oxidase family protein [Thermoleophilaceae bacterium]
MKIEALPEYARDLLATAPVGRLGLLDDAGRPRVLPVTFALHENALWSAVDHKPKRRDQELARLRWLRHRPEAALTVDVYDDDWSRLRWVQVLGTVEILEASAAERPLAALVAKYPQYAEQRPAGPLLHLTPERVLHWSASEG